MQTRTEVTLTAPAEPGTQQCGCGCECGDRADPAGCAHRTIVRPRFYCGQLLTDLDMSALVDWGRRRLGLSRHRDGWGVVCGLDVRSTPKIPGSVTIRPGYAVSCCGDDILVAEDHVLDLAELGEADRQACAGRGEQQDLPLLADVFLTYREEDVDPHTAFVRACCAETAECENSRTREVFRAYPRKAPGKDDDPVATDAAVWKLGYDACLDVISTYQQDFPQHDPSRADAVRTWLLRWIDDHPPRDRCTLRADINDATAPSESDITDWLFHLAQEARGAYLTGACPACTADAGVRIARVALQPGADETWTVENIDVYPPYRRPLSVGTWPAPLGMVNAAQMLWHRWTEASTRFADLGMSVAGTTEFTVPTTVAALKTALTCDPFVPWGTGAVVELYGPDKRVVGFCGGTGPLPTDPAQPLKLAVSKTSTVRFAKVGGTIPYEVTVRNEDTVEMTVQVQDDDRPGGFAPRTLLPGASSVYSYQTTVPAGATREVTNKVAVAATAGNRTGWADVQLAIPVVGLRLTKSGPKTAKPGDRVRFDFRVENTSALIALPVQVTDPALGLDLQETVQPGSAWLFAATYRLPDEAKDVLRNEATAAASLDGDQVADAFAYHEITVDTDKGDQDLIRIDGIGKNRAQALKDGGVRNLGELATATSDRIRELLPGISERTAQEWIRGAREAIA